jgi:hypothetical protein
MGIVRKPSNSVCYTPSSEPYRIYFLFVILHLAKENLRELQASSKFFPGQCRMESVIKGNKWLNWTTQSSVSSRQELCRCSGGLVSYEVLQSAISRDDTR